MSGTAVVLFNLGGPDKPESVLPFLRNLFADPAILRMPAPVRWLLGRYIAAKRAPIARAVYDRIGGGSPIVPQTEAQASALTREIERIRPDLAPVRTVIAMRYWHPRAAAAAAAVRAMAPDHVVLLPLYPQYSTTTTASSLREWRDVGGADGLAIGCYAVEDWFAASYAEQVRPLLAQAEALGAPRILFSAHGLPQRIADSGDPYPAHTQRTAAAVARALGWLDRDWRLCYQSRVGRLAWIGPSTEEEIRRAGVDRKPIVVVPIAFVSEHSETLVELDLEGRELAHTHGVPGYFRAPTVSAAPSFIAGLAALVDAGLRGKLGACPRDPALRCPTAVCGART